VTPPLLHQLNLIARNIDASVDFYRTLGLPVESAPGDQHVELKLPNGLSIEWDTTESVALWDSGWMGAGGGQGIVLGFQVATRVAVDEKYADLTTAGHPGHQPPYDAFGVLAMPSSKTPMATASGS
jgi:catechol 2,3-dioxygenase-like lactoylglutathione lyase family enzyme